MGQMKYSLFCLKIEYKIEKCVKMNQKLSPAKRKNVLVLNVALKCVLGCGPGIYTI